MAAGDEIAQAPNRGTRMALGVHSNGLQRGVCRIPPRIGLLLLIVELIIVILIIVILIIVILVIVILVIVILIIVILIIVILADFPTDLRLFFSLFCGLFLLWSLSFLCSSVVLVKTSSKHEQVFVLQC